MSEPRIKNFEPGLAMPDLPVRDVLPEIARELATNRPVVLQAPPGSGKTTLVAPSLLDAPWLQGRRIVLLEPRRLAARAAARYMARLLGEEVGRRVGYHIRLERRVGPETRIEVLTEGLLTQRLLHDPELPDVGLVIFDEFHERSLAADAGLALALDVRRHLRPDLRLLAMSATLDAQPVAEHLGNGAVVAAEGRAWPVETRLAARASTAPVPWQVADAVARVVTEEPGSVLAFLPGEGEIRRVVERLRAARLPSDVSVHPLFAALPRAAQDSAIEPPAPGRRKIVLATSIAESSLTILGVREVGHDDRVHASRLGRIVLHDDAARVQADLIAFLHALQHNAVGAEIRGHGAVVDLVIRQAYDSQERNRNCRVEEGGLGVQGGQVSNERFGGRLGHNFVAGPNGRIAGKSQGIRGRTESQLALFEQEPIGRHG